MLFFTIEDEYHSFCNGDIFTTKSAIESLTSYHWVDWTDEKYPCLRDFINNLKPKEKLPFLLEHGQWTQKPASILDYIKQQVK